MITTLKQNSLISFTEFLLNNKELNIEEIIIHNQDRNNIVDLKMLDFCKFQDYEIRMRLLQSTDSHELGIFPYIIEFLNNELSPLESSNKTEDLKLICKGHALPIILKELKNFND